MLLAVRYFFRIRKETPCAKTVTLTASVKTLSRLNRHAIHITIRLFRYIAYSLEVIVTCLHVNGTTLSQENVKILPMIADWLIKTRTALNFVGCWNSGLSESLRKATIGLLNSYGTPSNGTHARNLCDSKNISWVVWSCPVAYLLTLGFKQKYVTTA